ncbi:MAG: type II toxin-antitoxin system VapC family toxin [Pirellulales bacterium]
MAASVYLETTIPSYLTARTSVDIVMAARQQITREWWDGHRAGYDLYVSQLVLDEASAGDAEAVARRLAALDNIPLIHAQPGTDSLVETLIQELALPDRAAADAAHIALAVLNGIDFLLTWNCTHIANARNRPIIEQACRQFGFRPPTICTPEELL